MSALSNPQIRTTDTHIYFLGGILSNWYASPKAFIGTRALDLCIATLDAMQIPHPDEAAVSTRLIRDFRFGRGEQWMMAMKAWLFEGVPGADQQPPGLNLDEFRRLQNQVLATRGAPADPQRKELWGSALCRILRTNSPKAQKMIGRKVPGFRDDLWSRAAGVIVVAGCVARAEVDPELKALYLASRGRKFVEGSRNDCVWAVGLDWMSEEILDERNWRGMNKLGESHDAAAKILLCGK
ncbi:hypothetical protein P175DRAFT_0503294 [Aspergillus ochraceoroseus IBT 24754]|uniref:NADAR domain-containing protein n=2 Tax=Aspergillus ochraceoroseus TaxID=138278 RepID=A0A2T5LQE0_9EURO|nr:uncharacterized protein P175DRAFT_0503294 [Aspergillus ochraceoroseus IBT 24754]KKK14055.1 hypothetical protein AOCH_002698 [Aspergillus ochraceoroseus]PTU18493.1 hypothetical protein P175DRAFT_0503294 [Aspergillus ochraceoroseus IBT 24754]